MEGSIAAAGVAPDVPWIPSWGAILMATLVAGVAARTGWLLVGSMRLRSIRARSTPAVVADDIEALRAELAPRAELRWSSDVAQPVTFGVRHPVILLPPSCDALNADEQRAVACHELLHVARRDWGWIVLEEHLRSLSWFHPGAWWLIGQIQASREQLIDRLVVARLGDRRAYMSALIAFAGAGAPMPATSFVRRRQLKSRLTLLTQEITMSPKRFAWTAAALTLILSATTVGIGRALPLEVPMPAAQTGAAPRLEIRLAEDAPGAGLAEIVLPGSARRIYLHPTAIATNVDITSAQIVESAGSRFDLAVTFNPIAAERLMAATRTHIGKPLAILVDGRVVAVPVVRSEIGDAAVINGNFSSAEALALAAGLVPSDRRATVIAGPGPGIVMPRVLKTVSPAYTSAGMAARIEGTVVLRAIVEADGTVADVSVVRSLDAASGLDDQAVAAVRQWRFRPGTKDGKVVATSVQIETNFNMR
jgi:TonB family protein